MAFILALVVRGFEAQAFVIPTGSMAPTLMGRHKEIACPQCGFVYAVNASQEAEVQSASHSRLLRALRQLPVSGRAPGRRAELQGRPNSGDDVSLRPAFLPGSGPPERWDVVVFRYPEEPEVSYIKRLVGLPGETIRIYHGDVFVKSAGSDTFMQARKPMRHQSATQITVYDDRHRPQALERQGRMAAVARRCTMAGRPSIPRAVDTSRKAVRKTSGSSCGIGISSLIPSNGTRSESDRTLPREPRATLITDFYSYNTNMSADYSNLLDDVQRDQESAWMQPHWVGDLTLEANLEVTKRRPDASVRLELVKAGLAASLHDRPGDRDGRRDPGRGRAGQVGDADQGPWALPGSNSPTSTIV